ncbi:MAG: virulence RhuM family protein [bacterium]|nr:virulence RhuM family protein [bacterium]
MSRINAVSSQSLMSSIVLYQTEDGRTRLQCRFDGDTIWLTQAMLAVLFEKDVRTINEHLTHIYEEGELSREATIRKFRIVRIEGQREVARDIEHYNLMAILGVGYRVRSDRGTQFRQWATARLEEYLVKGFTMDDERLKNPPGPGMTDHFDELLERIRDIRASEQRMYLRVREIFALASDYQASSATTIEAFKIIQNKLHFTVTGKTAPELIAERADALQPNMGLTSWKSGVVRKGDVTVAKNYLKESEIDELNRIVVMFLDFAEDQARRKQQIFLRDWPIKLDEFLAFNDRDVLMHAGHVTREQADSHAQHAYEDYSARRRAELEADAENDNLKQIEDELSKYSGTRDEKNNSKQKPA